MQKKTKLSNEEIEEVKRLAKDFFNGSKKLAVAGLLHGVGFVIKHGGRLPDGVDKGQIGRLSAQVTKAKKKQ